MGKIHVQLFVTVYSDGTARMQSSEVEIET